MPLVTQLFLTKREVTDLKRELKTEQARRSRVRRKLAKLQEELQTLEHLILTDPLRAVEAVRKLKE